MLVHQGVFHKLPLKPQAMEILLSGLAGELCGLAAKGGECIAELKRSFEVGRGVRRGGVGG